MELPIYSVDAFADQAFAGNPAAVCLDITQKGLSDEVMQKIAAELNLPVTAFIQKKQSEETFENGATFKLKFFIPEKELPLCGHATFASSAVLFNCIGNKNESLQFEASGGNLKAQNRDGRVTLELPLLKPAPVAKDGLADFIKLVIGKLDIQELLYATSPDVLIVRLPDSTTRKELEDLTPAFDQMKSAKTSKPIDVVAVTVRGSQAVGAVDEHGEMFDFISRVFTATKEDAVCGAAHMALSPYWASELQKNTLYARQCSKRGGNLNLDVKDYLDVSAPNTVFMKGSIFI